MRSRARFAGIAVMLGYAIATVGAPPATGSFDADPALHAYALGESPHADFSGVTWRDEVTGLEIPSPLSTVQAAEPASPSPGGAPGAPAMAVSMYDSCTGNSYYKVVYTKWYDSSTYTLCFAGTGTWEGNPDAASVIAVCPGTRTGHIYYRSPQSNYFWSTKRTGDGSNTCYYFNGKAVNFYKVRLY